MNLVLMTSNILFLSVIVGITSYGFLKKVPVFDSFIEGAQEGFSVMVKLVPILVGMLTGISMLRASGFFDILHKILGPILNKFGVHSDLIPLMFTRPFSGSASNAVLVDIIHQHGGNSLIAHTAATMIGSTETTFYLVAVYFGSVQIKQLRYAVLVGITADAVGIIASIIICRLLLDYQ